MFLIFFDFFVVFQNSKMCVHMFFQRSLLIKIDQKTSKKKNIKKHQIWSQNRSKSITHRSKSIKNDQKTSKKHQIWSKSIKNDQNRSKIIRFDHKCLWPRWICNDSPLPQTHDWPRRICNASPLPQTHDWPRRICNDSPLPQTHHWPCRCCFQ